MVKLKLDLHNIFSNSRAIDVALHSYMQDAIDKRAESLEIIPGKGSGQLKKSVLRFLARSDIRQMYHRVEKDDKNFGRIFVHFRF